MSVLAALFLGAAEYRDLKPEIDCPQLVALRDAATEPSAFAALLAAGGAPKVSPLYCTTSGIGTWWCTMALAPDGVRRDSLAEAITACLPDAVVRRGAGEGWRLGPTVIRSGALQVEIEQSGSPAHHVGVSVELMFSIAGSPTTGN